MKKTDKISTCALKISMRPSVIPSLARNLNLPLKSEMSRFRFAPLGMTFCLLRIDFVINLPTYLTPVKLRSRS